jgi:uncharacterized RDD family membrane protein YckC
MTEQPRIPTPGVYPPPLPPGGSQAPSPGAGWPPAGQPVDDLPTEAYVSWIRRVGAALIDAVLGGILYWAMVGIVVGIFRLICTTDACRNSAIGGIVILTVPLVVLAFFLWNFGYRQGRTGSSIGKTLLRFKVLSERTGDPIGFGMSVVREIAHFLDGICYVGYLLPLFSAKRQTIADMILGTVCLPTEPPQELRSRTPRPRIRMALAVVVLACAAILTVLVCLTSTSAIAFHTFLGPYVQAAFVPPLWTAGILIFRRYYPATYALVPIAGIVAILIFAQGRYDWDWESNYFAFLACVFVTTAVSVLIAWGITRSVAARQEEAAYSRERKAARQRSG